MDYTHICPSCGNEFETPWEREYLCPRCQRKAALENDTARKDRAGERFPQPITAWMPDFELLNQFKVIRLIGESGVSRVYQVEDRWSGRMLAVKCPRFESGSTASLEAVLREVEIFFRLHLSPHVLQIEQARLWQGIPLIFAELAEGGDLSLAIQKRVLYSSGKQAALKRILTIAIQSAWGLSWIHQARVVHGDIKPANILLTKDSQVRIAGFGLSQVLPDGQAEVPCQGYTPAFASPEQSRNGPISWKSDLWNWGVSLLEMFTGEITWFRGIAAPEALEAYLEQDEVEPDLPVMPARLAALLHHCFQEDPAARPENMDWIARKLQDIYQHVYGEKYKYGWMDPQLEPEKLDYLLHRGIWYFELGDFDQAARQFTQAVRNYPQSAWARFNLGLTYLNQHPQDPQAAQAYFVPLPSYQDPGFSVGQVSSHFMSVQDIRVDLDRHLVWVAGDIGIALVGGPSYAPYDFRGKNLPPEQLPEFGDPKNWFRYGNTDRSPWQLSGKYFSLPGLARDSETAPRSYHSEALLFCQECGRDVSRWANQDGRAERLRDLVAYLCPACAEIIILQVEPVFGEYRPLKRLGGSQIETYYHAWHRPTCRVVRLEAFDIENYQKHFPQASYYYFQSWRELDHPNLLLPFDDGQVGGWVYMVYELDPGTNLEAYLERQAGVLPLEQAVEITFQILDGLHYLHQKGLVHRNVKPLNILIKMDDQSTLARLSDFELMKRFENADNDFEREGAFAGTLPFMPPEQVTQFKHVKPPTDIFSIGATLYYLLTGCYPFPFPCRSENARLWRDEPVKVLLRENTIPIRQRLPDLPEGIAAVIEKAVCRMVDDRYQTALEFKQALLSALESSQATEVTRLPLTVEREADTVLRSSGGYSPRLTVRCARCGADISDLANSDGRTGELEEEVIYWCPECSWKQFPFQSYRINEMGFVEYQGLGGGLASTVLGWQASTGRVAAIRRVYFWRDQEQSTKHLLDDWERLATIVHPNCTRIIQTTSGAGAVLVASAYIQEAAFSELVKTRPGGILSPHAAVTVGLKLLDGLEQIHALGFTHANLHPGNILFQARDFARPKICLADFSPNYVYSFSSYDPERDHPVVNQTSLPFLVPDLILGTSRREPAWDLYSIGQLLYLLLAGKISQQLPDDLDSTDLDRLAEVLVKPEPVAIRDREPTIPGQLAIVIDRSVGKHPGERFATIAEFRQALQQVLEAL